MEGAETPLAVSVVAVITVLLWTLMKGIALVSSTECSNLIHYSKWTTICVIDINFNHSLVPSSVLLGFTAFLFGVVVNLLSLDVGQF